MSEGKIGLLSSGEVRGVMSDLLDKLAGSEGPVYLRESKHFINKEPCWVSATMPAAQSLQPRKRRARKSQKQQVRFWKRLYEREFEIDLDLLSTIVIPPRQQEASRLLIVAGGLTLNQVIAACKRHFLTSASDEDMDKAVPTNERDPKNGSYAIWVRDHVEADEGLKDLSAQDHTDAGRQTETLLERCLHELAYFLETGDHLDKKNVTLCSGSRSSDGYVPRAYWHGGFRVRAYYFSVRSARPRLRARQVFSLPAAPPAGGAQAA